MRHLIIYFIFFLFSFVGTTAAGLFYPQLGQQLAHASAVGENHSSNSGNAAGASAILAGSGGGAGALSQKSSLSSPSENAPSAEMPLDLSAKSTTPTFPHDLRNNFHSISR